MTRITALDLTLCCLAFAATAKAAPPSDWKLELGLRWFKLAAGAPTEIGAHRVHQRWESLAQDPSAANVHDYEPLKPLFFNFNFGADALVRFRDHLMIKVGYDYSNPLGIGGRGRISYQDVNSGTEILEEKEYSVVSHQITTFLGPIATLGDEEADVYLGFSPMAPTWVRYREHYRRTDGDSVTEDVERTWRGFFGSCRALVGLQVHVASQFKLGSEAVFAFLNTMKLRAGDDTDSSFEFPFMKWNVTARYEVF